MHTRIKIEKERALFIDISKRAAKIRPMLGDFGHLEETLYIRPHSKVACYDKPRVVRIYTNIEST